MKAHIALASIGLMILALSGCRGSVPAPSKGKSAEAAGVTTDTPKKRTLRRIIEQPASVEPYEETPLVARIPGYVERVHVDIGKRVEGPDYDMKGKQTRAGEILASLSIPDTEQELAQKSARVAHAQAEVEQAVASLKTAEAHTMTDQALVKEAEAARTRADANYQRWKSEYTRVDALVASKVVDKQLRDETLNQYKAAEAVRQETEAKVQTAEAHVKESVAKCDKARADVAAARAEVLVAQAEEGRLKALVEYRHIRAPFSGVVTRRNIHTGHYLQPNASGGPSVLFVVARTNLLRIQADIPEAEAGYIRVGMEGKIRIPILGDQTFKGMVSRTSVSLDARARTLRTEIDFPNNDDQLRPGMYANLIFTIDLADRLTLPKSAFFMHNDQPCCYRVENGKAIRRLVKLGVRDAQYIEVREIQREAKSGEPPVWEPITERDEIVVTNLGAVTEGKELPLASK